jgi:Flp pilus assembly protein TadG
LTVTIAIQKSARKRRGGTLGETGAALVEFALLAPVLLLIMVGMAQFGITLNQYVMLWNGVGAGATQFAISGVASSTPAQNAWNAIIASAPSLTTGGSCTTTSLCMSLTVNASACATNVNSLSAAAAVDSACSTKLQAGGGTPAIASATYPCNLTVMGVNFFPSCKLTATITELVQ